MTTKLYQNRFSPNAKRVRVLARELNLPLEIVELDFAKGEHKTPEYMAINPMGKVPTLVDQHGTYWESPSILVHLATDAKSPLLPADMTEVVRWTCWNASHLEGGVNTLLIERMFAPMMGRPADEAKIAQAAKDVARYAPVLDKHLATGPWITGASFTIADISVGTTIETGFMAAKEEFAPYANLRSWLGRVTERASWKD